jgi:hypothetical protein
MGELDLAEFIEENSDLFVVMGVFAASSVYILQLTSNSLSTATTAIQLGFTGSIMILLLMVYLIYRQMAREVGSWDELYKVHIHFRNIPVVVFSGGFLLLSSVLLSRVLAQGKAVYLILVFSAVFSGLGLTLRGLAEIDNHLGELSYQEFTLAAIFAVVFSGVFRATIYYIRQEVSLLSYGDYNIFQNIQELSISFALLFTVTVQSITALFTMVLVLAWIIYTIKIAYEEASGQIGNWT